MNQAAQQVVKLRDLLALQSRGELAHLFVASDAAAVRGVTLISDIEEIAAVGPDMIIALSADVARGSWMVSAALRYAWERHAAALIIPDRSLNPSVLQLAERFGVSMFTTAFDLTGVTIEVATQLGFARAQLVSSLQQLTQLVDVSEDATEVLAFASQWLQGARVSLESSGAVVRTAGGGGGTGEPTTGGMPGRVSVAVGSAPTHAGFLIVDTQSGLRDRARAVLEICATKLRALLAEAQLVALQRSLPPMSIAALGLGKARLPTSPLSAGWPEWPDLPAWAGRGGFIALCLLSSQTTKYGAALHQLWLAEFRECPLVQGTEGWLAFVPVEEGAGEALVLERMRARLAEIHLLDLRIGASRPHSEPAQLREAVREAWLAGRVAEGGADHALVSYGDLPNAALANLLPAALAEELLEMRFPELAVDEARAELCALFCEYAATLGSATATAARLGIHRNTVTQRLARLEQLGVPVGVPEETLGVHLLLGAFAGGNAAREG